MKHLVLSFKRIMQDVKELQTQFGMAATTTLSGLQSPVYVRHADDRHIELFLNYHLGITLETDTP